MREYNIVIRSLDEVNSFVNMADRIDGEVILSEDDCEVDAKAILGIFSLDLSRCMKIIVKNWREEYTPLIAKYVA